MFSFWKKKQKPSKSNLPNLPNYPPPKQRILSPEELQRLQQKAIIEQQKSLFKLAQRTVSAYFVLFFLLSSLLLLYNFRGVDSTDLKWLITRYLEMSSPLVTAVVFYYFGNSKRT